MGHDFLKTLKAKKYLFLISIIYIIYASIAIHNDADWDLWARFAVGKIFLQTYTVLHHDIFAYTSVKNIWIDNEWGSGVIFYLLGHYCGDLGLCLLRFFIMLTIFLLVFKINELRSKDNVDPYKISYYLIFIYGIWPAFEATIRSQCFTYLFFALWLYLLEMIKQGKNKLIIFFPLTMIIWANTHGGFLAGLGIVALYGIGEAFNKRSFSKYFGILGLSGLATLINPYGIKYWSFIISAVTMNRPYIAEWDPLNLFGPVVQVMGFKIFAVLTLLSFIFLFIRRFREINWSEILILGATFYMSMQHIRHVIFFVIASGAYIYYYFYPAFNWLTFNIVAKFYSIFPYRLRLTGKIFRDTVCYGSILLICLSTIVFIPMKIKVNEKKFPVRAVEFIQQNNLSGNLLVLFNWGSYALWKLYPQCRIAVDGRYEEVYSQELMDDVARFHYLGIGWDELLTKYHTDVMLIPLIYDDLYKRLSTLKDWKIIYQDKYAAVFILKTKDKAHWTIPDKKFDPNKEKYLSQIRTIKKH